MCVGLLLYVDEFGYRKQNLHCHGLLLSPSVAQELLSEWWSKIRGDGSYRVVIGQAAGQLRERVKYPNIVSRRNS